MCFLLIPFPIPKSTLESLTCEGECAVLPFQHALLDVRVEHGGDDEAGDDHDGVPGRADEPHHLVHGRQHVGLQSIGLPEQHGLRKKSTKGGEDVIEKYFHSLYRSQIDGR